MLMLDIPSFFDRLLNNIILNFILYNMIETNLILTNKIKKNKHLWGNILLTTREGIIK